MGRPPRNNIAKAGVKLPSNPSSVTPEFEDVPVEPLSGRAFFDFILSKKRPMTQMVFPPKMNSELPNGRVPVVITYGKNTWRTILCVSRNKKSLDSTTWKDFLKDNKVKYGDGLILQVMEIKKDLIKLKAQILRGDFPAELDAQISGGALENAITIE
ncbi:unnamed protein product [Cuscuta epithymum]|uniref:TF-B3 domain-containing protein n=1 Tax=Cuscuta epithymum TaxID=186058 RepID=A0AAV0EBA5_9ASTE|nr:unnamed protein product [Cuscuta epithymum]CAH9119487.1 unnamed protein product [Cuscuta epithymum]